jgi:hypothetical protein
LDIGVTKGKALPNMAIMMLYWICPGTPTLCKYTSLSNCCSVFDISILMQPPPGFGEKISAGNFGKKTLQKWQKQFCSNRRISFAARVISLETGNEKENLAVARW